MGSTDPRPKPINWPRELADAADTIERLLKLRRCPEPGCHNGLVPDLRTIRHIENAQLGAVFPVATTMDHKPCPRCRRDWDALKHARALLGRSEG